MNVPVALQARGTDPRHHRARAHYAHQRGVIHRDLKPQNILLDRQDQPHLTDFGLAKLLERDTGLTLSETVMGSPAYMAPEQASGHTKHLTTAADIYSLGAILYVLLTGRPPFQAKTSIATLRQVVEGNPTRPSAINEGLDLDLETICLKCLEKEPQRRYRSAEMLAEDLDRWQVGEPIHARPLPPAQRFWRWCRRNPGPAILSGAITVLLFAVAIGSTLAAVRINRAERVATEKLYDSYIAQARAMRRNSREGQRFESFKAVLKAAAIRSSPELRDEAIACLAVTDVRFSDTRKSTDLEGEIWDSDAHVRAVLQADGSIRLLRGQDNSEVAVLPSLKAEVLERMPSVPADVTSRSPMRAGDAWFGTSGKCNPRSTTYPAPSPPISARTIRRSPSCHRTATCVGSR